jgi:hypothetical protein
MEEDTTPPRRNDALLLGGMRATNKEHVHEVYRTSRAYGGAARSTSTIDPFNRATSIHSAIFLIWLHHIVGGGGEETLSS